MRVIHIFVLASGRSSASVGILMALDLAIDLAIEEKHWHAQLLIIFNRRFTKPYEAQ
jgi:hypothetical protein